MSDCSNDDNDVTAAADVLVLHRSDSAHAHTHAQSSTIHWFGVRTDPGKVWKVLEFNVEIFKALKSLENDHRYGKVWKNP